MGDFIIAIHVFITLVTVMILVINYSSGIDTTFFRAFVQSKTVVPYYYFCGITDLILAAESILLPLF